MSLNPGGGCGSQISGLWSPLQIQPFSPLIEGLEAAGPLRDAQNIAQQYIGESGLH